MIKLIERSMEMKKIQTNLKVYHLGRDGFICSLAALLQFFVQLYIGKKRISYMITAKSIAIGSVALGF